MSVHVNIGFGDDGILARYQQEHQQPPPRPPQESVVTSTLPMIEASNALNFKDCFIPPRPNDHLRKLESNTIMVIKYITCLAGLGNSQSRSMGDLQQFHGIVAALLSQKNEEREAAEKLYNDVSNSQKAINLHQLAIDGSVSHEVRDMSLVLLRRLVADKLEEINAAIPSELSQIKKQLIQATTSEQASSIRKRLTDVISDIARQTINDEGVQTWDTVIEFIGHCGVADNAGLREAAMILIENVPNIFGVKQRQFIDDIKQMFKSCLLFNDDGSVRISAVRAYVSFMVDNEEDQDIIRHFSDVISEVLQVCEHIIANDTEDDTALESLVDLATSVPKSLPPYFRQIFELFLTTAVNKEKNESYRQSSMEILVSLCESAPALIRKKASPFIEPLVQHCFSLMTELDDDLAEWLAVDDFEEDVEEEMASLGETSIDRVACALGPKSVFPPAYRVIGQFIRSQNWKERHSGIFGLSTIGEGCKRQMEPHIRDIVVEALIPLLTDEHPRVRYAACNAIGQMSSDFGPTLQKKCHELVMPALLSCTIDISCPRVSAHALAALVNFAEECPKNIMSIYLDQIMKKMQWVLDQTFSQFMGSGKKIVLFQVISTIASVAESAQEHFSKFYALLMPPLKHILESSKDKELSELRGKTIECISLIGLAVGRELFSPDIHEIMEQLSNCTGVDDANSSYVISAWARICKVLGEDFAPYLGIVMPTVFKCANYNPEMALLNDDDDEDDPDWEFLDMGGHSPSLDDKNTACEMLVCFAREIGAAFAPYADDVSEFMESQLNFMFHEGVRSSAAEIFPYLFLSIRGDDKKRRRLWQRIFPQLVETLSTETDLELAGEFIYSIGRSVEELGPSVVSTEDIHTIVKIIIAQMGKYETRRLKRESASRDDEIDEESQEGLNETIELETSIRGRICDLIHFVYMAFKEDFTQLFDPIGLAFAPLLKLTRPFHDRQFAICVFDDVIEFGGENGVRYQDVFAEPLLNALADTYPEVRQSAAYGIGRMGMAPKGIYNHLLSGAMERLVAMISRADARSTEESSIATENAVSAVAKILKYSNAVDANLVISTFVSWLPTWEDAEETPYVYDYFCDLVEGNHPAVLGENNCNLLNVVKIIIQAFCHEALDDSTELAVNSKQRLATILKVLSQNKELFDPILQHLQLNSHQQQTLAAILSS